MTISYTLGGGGSYIAQIANSEAAIDFGNHPLAAIETIEVVGPKNARVTSYENANAMTFVSYDPAPDGLNSFKTNLKSSAGDDLYALAIAGDVDNSAGVESMKFRPECAMGSILAPTRAIHHGSIQFRMPAIGGDSSRCRVVVCDPQPQVTSWAQVKGSTTGGTDAYALSHPGFSNRGGERSLNPPGDTTNESDEPSGYTRGIRPCWYQFVYVWNIDSGVGCLFRATDVVGQGKILAIWRDEATDDFVVECRFVPQDHSVGSNNASDSVFDWALEVRPMQSVAGVSGWYDALRYVESQMVASAHSAMQKGTLDSRVDVPPRIESLLFFSAVTGGDTSSGFDWTLYSKNVSSILAGLELDGTELVVSVYDFWDGLIGAHFPTVLWDVGAPEAVQAIFDTGATTIVYTIPGENGVWFGDPGSETGLPPGLLINSDLSLDRFGEKITGEADIAPADEYGEVYVPPNFIDEVANAELYDFIFDELSAPFLPGALPAHGVYDDQTNAWAPPPNDDPALAPKDRGFGSQSWWPSQRARYDLWRTRLSALGIENPILVAEHPSEMSAGWVYLAFEESVGPGIGRDPETGEGSPMWDLTTSRLPMAILVGPYQTSTNFSSFGNGPVDEFAGYTVPGHASLAEVWISVFSDYFHRGIVPPLLRYFANSDDVYFPPDMDAGYLAWRDYLRVAFVRLKAAVIHYRRARKLRELASSHIERMIEARIRNDIFYMVAPEAKLHSSIWYDSANDVVALWGTNWSLGGYANHPATLAWDDALDVVSHPDLGASPREVWAYNLRTGSKTRRADYNGAGYKLDLVLGPQDHYLVEMIPVGSGAGFIAGLADAEEIAQTGVFPDSTIAQGGVL